MAKRNIDKLYKRIENTQKQIEKLRKECKHKSFRVELYSWRVGSYLPQRLCKKCDAVVPGITEKESKPFYDSMQATFGQGTALGNPSFTITNLK